ncbi:MAG TPA: PxKF domain-containing protein, partial [Mycobacteriales bacterium]|nr:PxKF domain-containing protein [Mycobacteriales bacterium]
ELPPDQTVLVTGYNLLTDGGAESADALAARLGADKVARLICETWTRADLLRHLTGPMSPGTGTCNAAATAPVDIAAVNGHADHYRLQPAAGTGAAGDGDDLVSSADLSALAPGRIIFSVGCHFGLGVADSTVSTPTAEQATRLKDWAETIGGDRAGILVANYGYGYGDTEAVGYSEKLMSLFAARLGGGRSVGEALLDAKRTYFLEHMGLNGAFDQKSLQIAAMYGPPQMRVDASAPAPPTPPTATVLQTDPVSGLAYAPFDSGAIGYDSTTGPNGRIVSIDGGVLLADRRPVLPQASYDVTNRDSARPGQRAIGFFLTGFDATTESGQDLAHSRALADDALGEPQSLGDFPIGPGTVTSIGAEQRFLLWPAQFSPTSPAGARKVVGDLQLRSNVRGMVLYSDKTGPAARFLSVSTEYVDPGQTQVTVSARVYSASPVRRVNFFVDSRAVDLQRTSASATGISTWSGTVTVTAGSGRKVLGQAVNDSAVSYWGNKGDDARTTSETADGLRITMTSAAGPPVNGWFTGDVTASVTQSDGSPLVTATEYSLDRAAYEPYTAPVTVTGTGLHPFSARTYDSAVPTERSATRTAFIDVTPPAVLISRPQATTYELNAVVPSAVSCTDAGSGVQSCLAPAKADTSRAGTFTFTATSTDVAGNMTTREVTYTVLADTIAPTASISSPTDGLVVDYGQKVTVTYSCGDTGGSGVVSCTGPVASGGLLNTQTAGTFQFCVTATDASGNTTRTCRTYTVRALRFEGFLTPIVNPPEVNATSAGNTLVFRFRVFNGSTEMKDPIAFKFAWRTVTSFAPLAYRLPDPHTQTAVSNPATKYDPTDGSVHFNALTDRKWRNSKRVFVVILPDGQERMAHVQF